MRWIRFVVHMVSAILITTSTVVAADRVLDPDKPMVARPKIGLVLSGGGARGAAHVGVIKVLDQLNVPIDYIAGTSMGAIVGGLFASGMPAQELEQVFLTSDWPLLLNDRPPRNQRSFRRKNDDDGFLVDFNLGINSNGILFPGGLVQGQNLEIELKRLTLPVTSITDFDQLPIPFRGVATDIVSGKTVILDAGDLASAMRASMSAPGLFTPVRHENRILVDGGIVNNLPIQVVRDMGADIVIAVDVGFPLLPEEDLASALEFTMQMLTILINDRARAQSQRLNENDILIIPTLGDLGSQDFQRMPEALLLGTEKAIDGTETLKKLSISDELYRKHRLEISGKRRTIPVIDKVVVQNESRLSPKVIEAQITDPVNKHLDVNQLQDDIVDIYGFDTFGTVTFDIADDHNDTVLTLRATQNSLGPNYLRFGVNLEDDFDGESNYNIAARMTRTEINRKGGELRADIQLGETPRIFAEYFQPLDYASNWFVNPQLEFTSSTTDLVQDGQQTARFRSDLSTFALEGGYQFANWGEIRLGLTWSQSNSSLKIGSPEMSIGSTDAAAISASFSYDTIDRLAIPKSGTNISLGWIGARSSLGSDTEIDIASLFFLNAKTWNNHTLLHWWNFGSTLSDESDGINTFSLGGFFNLSGYAPGELSAQDIGIGRLLYYRQLGGEAKALLDTPIYFGTSVEAGYLSNSGDTISNHRTTLAGSVFVVFDTLLGPLYIAYGAAEGNRESAYLFLGQTF